MKRILVILAAYYLVVVAVSIFCAMAVKHMQYPHQLYQVICPRQQVGGIDKYEVGMGVIEVHTTSGQTLQFSDMCIVEPEGK